MSAKEALETLCIGTPSAQIEAIAALAALAHTAALPPLAKKLADPDGEHSLRYRAALAIGRILREGAGDWAEHEELLLASLLTALREDDMWLRVATVAALLAMGTAAIPGLTDALQDERAAVRRAAAKALGKLAAEDALADLLRALQDIDQGTRRFAAEALGRIGHAAAVEALSESLRDADYKVREASGEALGLIGEAAAPTLVEALSDPDPEVGMHAIFALRAMNHSPDTSDSD